MNNGVQQIWAEIKNLWKYALVSQTDAINECRYILNRVCLHIQA